MCEGLALPETSQDTPVESTSNRIWYTFNIRETSGSYPGWVNVCPD